jgi:hypothetical protein
MTNPLTNLQTTIVITTNMYPWTHPLATAATTITLLAQAFIDPLTLSSTPHEKTQPTATTTISLTSQRQTRLSTKAKASRVSPMVATHHPVTPTKLPLQLPVISTPPRTPSLSRIPQRCTNVTPPSPPSLSRIPRRRTNAVTKPILDSPPTKRRVALTNRDGLVILSKSAFLFRLHGECRFLLDLDQLLNLCIDWLEVHRIACPPRKQKNVPKRSIEKKRQANYLDTGFCSSVCLTRNGTVDGIVEPRMKLGTDLPEVVNGYVVLSKFLSETPVKWSGKRLYFDSEVPDRKQRFAARIHPDNLLECMRLSATDLKAKCACHREEHNSGNPAFSAVIGMSVVREVGGKEVRITINAQAQKSIDDCLSRLQLYRPLLPRHTLQTLLGG